MPSIVFHDRAQGDMAVMQGKAAKRPQQFPVSAASKCAECNRSKRKAKTCRSRFGDALPDLMRHDRKSIDV